ncbi:MAG: hydantoinase B/oxoprolinase family protein [Bacteroidetes bacterium]|nr:MAG: hydantoinase B/oxoprolinase family protein [Bacteroidota bacterium]
MKAYDPISLEVYRHRFEGIAEEMGTALKRAAFSPNIKERLDYSCALFDAEGKLVAQAAHIPVHLGAMSESVQAAQERVGTWSPGDVVVLNDPYLGGTHLPDLTMISPVFDDVARSPLFFVATRAHHSDVGGMSPGSLPLSNEIFQEGIILPPVRLVSKGLINQDLLDVILRNVRTPGERKGDLSAQMAANDVGTSRLHELIRSFGAAEVADYARHLQQYSENRMRSMIDGWPDGEGSFEDDLDLIVDGVAARKVIRVKVTVGGETVDFNFEGSSLSGPHAYNAVLAITQSACYYVVRCLSSDDIPVNDGCFRPVSVRAPEGSIVNAGPPSAVAAGNVETSQRIVDAVLGAMAVLLPDRIPAASQGTMNNVTMGQATAGGSDPYVYYETIAGGIGASPDVDGLDCVHVHMTNTMNTPIEAFENAYPILITEYARRIGTGGKGAHRGGDGVIREYEFLEPTRVTMQSTRRTSTPWGLQGGCDGAPGLNTRISSEGKRTHLPAQFSETFFRGERLRVETPGGGGWGPSTGNYES